MRKLLRFSLIAALVATAISAAPAAGRAAAPAYRLAQTIPLRSR
jgi:hypothetical protein